jgi:hypothetical protein
MKTKSSKRNAQAGTPVLTTLLHRQGRLLYQFQLHRDACATNSQKSHCLTPSPNRQLLRVLRAFCEKF